MTLPPVAILAGGLGTRLGELTRDLPKPMIEIGGKPFLAHVVESFAVRGFRDFVLLVGHQAQVIERWFGDGGHLGVNIRYSREAEPQGTGGAVRDAAPMLGSRFILTYGDVLRRFDYDRFVTEHQGSCLAVYRFARGMTSVASGNVAMDDDGHVARFEKNAELAWVDAGFAVIETEVVSLLPGDGACSFEATVYPILAAAGRLSAEVVDLDFFDIGNPADLARTRLAVERP